MKKLIKVLFLAGAVTLLAGVKSNAQSIYIRVRPPEPVHIAPPPRPTPRHVWVEGEWEVRDGRYVHRDGYWVVPPHRHAYWVRGHWRHFRGGWAWIPGHWR